MGWLTDLTDWAGRTVDTVFQALVQFGNDMIVIVIENNLTLWLMILNAIPVPEFVQQYTVGGLLGNVGGDLGFFLGKLRIGEGLGLLGAGYAARLVRKALTLGQW